MPVEPGATLNVPVIRNWATVSHDPSTEAPVIVACPGFSALIVTPGDAFEELSVNFPYTPSARHTVEPLLAEFTAV